MTLPTSKKEELIRTARRAVEQFGTHPGYSCSTVADRKLIFPDLQIHVDESFRIFLCGDEWALVYEHDENGERELWPCREEMEAYYAEALSRLRRNLVLDALANI
jgi:hypothetical protein